MTLIRIDIIIDWIRCTLLYKIRIPECLVLGSCSSNLVQTIKQPRALWVAAGLSSRQDVLGDNIYYLNVHFRKFNNKDIFS
jgi:hypothetical protein